MPSHVRARRLLLDAADHVAHARAAYGPGSPAHRATLAVVTEYETLLRVVRARRPIPAGAR
jgi:hypothetical protein